MKFEYYYYGSTLVDHETTDYGDDNFEADTLDDALAKAAELTFEALDCCIDAMAIDAEQRCKPYTKPTSYAGYGSIIIDGISLCVVNVVSSHPGLDSTKNLDDGIREYLAVDSESEFAASMIIHQVHES